VPGGGGDGSRDAGGASAHDLGKWLGLEGRMQQVMHRSLLAVPPPDARAVLLVVGVPDGGMIFRAGGSGQDGGLRVRA
jgi:hypothetical protein